MVGDTFLSDLRAYLGYLKGLPSVPDKPRDSDSPYSPADFNIDLEPLARLVERYKELTQHQHGLLFQDVDAAGAV
jgi:hypothetical protein